MAMFVVKSIHIQINGQVMDLCINEHDIDMILREVERTELLSVADIKYIKSLLTMSFRTRILLSKNFQKGENGYKQFKFILFNLKRLNLLQTLIDNELVFEHLFDHSKQQNINASESQHPNFSAKNSQHTITIDVECKICMKTTLSAAFIPCGYTLCYNCSEVILKDQICCFCKQ